MPPDQTSVPVTDTSLPPFSDPDPELGRISLRTLVPIRWVAIAGQALALLTVHYGLGFHLPLRHLAARGRRLGGAQCRADRSSPGRARTQRALRRAVSRLRYPAARGAALPDRRPAQPVFDPVSGPGHRRGDDPVAAFCDGAVGPRRCRHQRPGVVALPAAVADRAAAVSARTRRRRLDGAGSRDRVYRSLHLERSARRAALARCGRGDPVGLGARAAGIGGWRACRRRRARAWQPARDDRSGRQGAGSRVVARQPLCARTPPCC